MSLVIGRAVGQSTVRKTQYYSKQTPYAGYSPTGTLRHHTRRRGHASCGPALQPTNATALSVPRLSAARTRGPTSDLHFSNLNEKLILLKDASAENLAGTWRRRCVTDDRGSTGSQCSFLSSGVLPATSCRCLPRRT